MIDDLVADKRAYLTAASGARMPADWVGSHRGKNGERVPERVDSDNDDDDNDTLRRHKFRHGGRHVYKEEDWVVDWWRKQPDADSSWAKPFLDVVEQLYRHNATIRLSKLPIVLHSPSLQKLWENLYSQLGSY